MIMKKKIYMLLALVMAAMTASAKTIPTYTFVVDDNEHGTITFKVGETPLTPDAESGAYTVAEGVEVTMVIAPEEGWAVYEPTVLWASALARVQSSIPRLVGTYAEACDEENTWTFTMERANAYVSVSYRKLLTHADITVSEIEPLTYTGEALKPAVSVMDGETPLVEGTDYTVSYQNNTNAAESTGENAPTVTITAVEGSYKYDGEAQRTFTINKATGWVIFSPWEYEKTMGLSSFTILPKYQGDGTLTYRSTNTSAATVDATTGEVTLKGVGTTKIYAILSEGSNYTGIYDWYYLKVLPGIDATELDEESDNSEQLEELAGSKANVTLKRTLQPGNWNTFSVPFDLSSSELSARGITVRELKTSSFVDGKLTMNFYNVKSIKAGKPYLVKVESTVENPTFENVLVKNAALTVETEAVNFIPTLGKTEVTGPEGDEDNKKAVYFLCAGNKLKNPSSLPADMKGFRGYFQLKGDVASANVRSITLTIEDDLTTEIVEVDGGQLTVDDAWYDLQGRKLDGEPTQSGVYIKNGKKVVVK